MFDTGFLDSKVNLTIAIICTLIVASIFIRMSFSYTHKRARKKFAKGKKTAPSLSIFRTLSKVLFVSSMLLTLTSYWLSPALLLSLEPAPYVQLSGACIVLIGYINLQRAFVNLGDNYSPLFDAYIPFNIVTSGAYRIIRHPIYLYNLFISFGLAVSSLSALVLINAIIGLVFVLKAIQLEEIYLAEQFSQYGTYLKRSWRLIPYLY